MSHKNKCKLDSNNVDAKQNDANVTEVNVEEADSESTPEVEVKSPEEIAKELLAKADEKINEYKDMAQRIQAEFDNYRKRNNESVKVARADGENCVILSTLPVLDSINIAIKMVKDEKSLEGLNLIKKQFDNYLQKLNVEEIKAEGEAFNPDYHNAVMQEEDKENAGKVVQELQKGYTRDGKVIRYSMVKVAVE